MGGHREQDAGVRFVAVYVAASVVAAAIVAALGWPWGAKLGIFALLFGGGYVLWERRHRHQ